MPFFFLGGGEGGVGGLGDFGVWRGARLSGLEEGWSPAGGSTLHERRVGGVRL